jgi:hypothetical protein
VFDLSTNKSLLPNSFRHRVTSRRNFGRELVSQGKRKDNFKLYINPPVSNGFNAGKHTGARFWLARLKVAGIETGKLVEIKDRFLESRPVGKKNNLTLAKLKDRNNP